MYALSASELELFVFEVSLVRGKRGGKEILKTVFNLTYETYEFTVE